MEKRAFRVHDLVVVSHKPDAAIYRVVEIDGFRIGVIDAELNIKQATQWNDVSIFTRPSNAQVSRITGA